MQQVNWPRGKVLGGSSSVNFMFYLRGHPLDYENWANLTGDPTWSWDNVLPYFKKSISQYKGEHQSNGSRIQTKKPCFSFFKSLCNLKVDLVQFQMAIMKVPNMASCTLKRRVSKILHESLQTLGKSWAMMKLM